MTMPTPTQRIWLQYLATGDRLVLMLSGHKISVATKRACERRGWSHMRTITPKGIDVLKEGTRRANAR